MQEVSDRSMGTFICGVHKDVQGRGWKEGGGISLWQCLGGLLSITLFFTFGWGRGGAKLEA